MGRTLVLGLGNELLGDDGVGLRVVELLRQRPALARFHFETADCAGLALLNVLAGYDQAIVVDCMQGGRRAVGGIRRLRFEEVDNPLTLSSHYAGLPDVLALAARLELRLPRVEVLAISVRDPYRVGTELSPPLERALPEIVAQAERLILEAGDA